MSLMQNKTFDFMFQGLALHGFGSVCDKLIFLLLPIHICVFRNVVIDLEWKVPNKNHHVLLATFQTLDIRFVIKTTTQDWHGMTPSEPPLPSSSSSFVSGPGPLPPPLPPLVPPHHPLPRAHQLLHTTTATRIGPSLLPIPSKGWGIGDGRRVTRHA